MPVVAEAPAARAHVLRHPAEQVGTRRAALADDGSVLERTAAWLLADGAGRVPPPGGQRGLADSLGAGRVSVHRALPGSPPRVPSGSSRAR